MTQKRKQRWRTLKQHHKTRIELRIALGSWALASLALTFAFCSSAQLTSVAKDAKSTTADQLTRTAATSPWNSSCGWHGVVVGESTLKEAEAKLGPGHLLSNQNGLGQYEFGKGVHITVLSSNSKVMQIQVTDEIGSDSQFPASVKEAKRMYQVLGSDAPGVKMTFSGGSDPHLTTLRFVEVKIEDDGKILKESHHRN